VRRSTGISAVFGVIVAAALLPVGALAAVPASSAPAPTATTSAAAASTDAAGIVYPLTSFLDWAENPVDDLTNPTLGEYALTQEIDEAEASVGQQFPAEVTAALGGGTAGSDGGSDAVAFSEQMAAELAHLRPVVADDDVTDMANPDFMPDFDHDGVFGDPGDLVAMEQGSQGPGGLGTPGSHVSGAFLYPCLSDTGAVTYETSSGTCAPAGTAGDTYTTGLAEQETIVDSRGLALAATLWLPATALVSRPQPHSFPTVVISDGIASDQSDYFWLAMSLAAQGDVVLTYDPAGQGASEGSAANLFEPSTPDCSIGGACRDLEDVVRWILDDPITPIVDLSQSTPLAPGPAVQPNPQAQAATASNPDILDPADEPEGENVPDPALHLVDPSRLAVVGHSMGALSLLNYLWYQSQGPDGADGQPLPPLAAGIALSGAAPTAAVVPLQFQTSDFDGSPSLLGPAVAGEDLSFGDGGIGYAQMKPLYDQLRASGPGTSALSLIVLEGGVHTDFIDTPFITRTPWSLAVSAHYATAWLDCYLGDNPASCLGAVAPVAHLLTSFASEVAPPTGPLPHPSRCITVPTTASLDDPLPQLGDALQGHPDFTCIP
jgi:hypothetical protein